MNKCRRALKIVAFSVRAALGSSFGVLLLAAFVFGLHLTDQEAVLLAVVATVVALAAASAGMRTARRAGR